VQELALKKIIVRGRHLVRHDRNAALKDAEEVRRIHNLLDLWNLALTEAKPKIDLGTWVSYGIQFVEQCMEWSSTNGTKQDTPDNDHRI
jgi:hypothetical protein